MEVDGMTFLHDSNRHEADNHFVLPKALFQPGPPHAPIQQVELPGHYFEDDNVVFEGLSTLPPQPLGGRLQICRHPLELTAEVIFHTLKFGVCEGRSSIVCSGEQDLDKMHGGFSLTLGVPQFPLGPDDHPGPSRLRV
jgi:hypothetical protein